MSKKPTVSSSAAELRRRAEARLRKKQKNNRPSTGDDRKSAADTSRLLHELQVHQIELEMQNAELQEARIDSEALLDRYTDLYDFAPVGYFSLDEQGRILETNLTASALLGMERSGLVGRYMSRLVAPASQPAFLSFLEKLFCEPGRRVCEARLLKVDGTAFWANIHGMAAISISGPRKWCRVAVSDITVLKQAEEAQRRMEAVSFANEELRKEIARRKVVESALQKSERHQRRLLKQARDMHGQLRHLSHQLLQAHEEERKRISRELHDQITQPLVSISVVLETLTRAAANPVELKRKIARTQRLVEKSVNILHQFARDLRPAALDDLGLVATLHSFMKEFAKRTGIRIHFKTFTSGWIRELHIDQSTILYRIAQEALTNVARHAGASRVDVSIQKLPRAIGLTIKDNGKSFQVHHTLRVKGNKHLGLLGMRERVEMAGGRFDIESTKGRGTTIRVQIPLRPNGRTKRPLALKTDEA